MGEFLSQALLSPQLRVGTLSPPSALGSWDSPSGFQGERPRPLRTRPCAGRWRGSLPGRSWRSRWGRRPRLHVPAAPELAAGELAGRTGRSSERGAATAAPPGAPALPEGARSREPGARRRRRRRRQRGPCLELASCSALSPDPRPSRPGPGSCRPETTPLGPFKSKRHQHRDICRCRHHRHLLYLPLLLLWELLPLPLHRHPRAVVFAVGNAHHRTHINATMSPAHFHDTGGFLELCSSQPPFQTVPPPIPA
ncbi:uncharacterized protein LOC123521529 [Echinops telfairi]|uniref:Uncharacterized protein LOC123521529 n=1 Tax=Echinops telfairi TaxID=9371 RepID=A0AC55CYN3_ECHTE|nr:uncharacterized protein LOC123521529 [Echinops telfairi]